MRSAKARVYFVNRYFYPDESATSQLLSDLAFGLARSGHEIHIVCSRQLYGSAGAELPAEEGIGGVHVHRVWTTRFGRRRLLGRALDYGSYYLTCAAMLVSRVRRGDIVVAKTDPPLISIVGWAAARVRRAVLINWLQDVFPEVASRLGANPLPGRLNRALERLRDGSLRAAACNVVLGTRMRDYLSGRLVAPAKLEVIENWAAGEDAKPKPSADSTLRARLGLSGKFVVGYSGNLGRAHEYETMLGAARALQADDEIAFLFIGGGVRMDELATQVARRGIKNFHFLPYQPRDQLADSLGAADIHLVSLLPALEGLIVPSKFYGILAVGRPVVFVGDPDGELARIIRQANCGHSVATGDSIGLAGVIGSMKSDSTGREAMSNAGHELLRSRFSAGRALASWTALLEEVRIARTSARTD